MIMTTPRLIIRADAAPRLGTGHVMRCLALALTARRAGVEACLVCRVGVQWVLERLKREAVPHILLNGEPPSVENPDDLMKQLRMIGTPTAGSAAWVVMDGYHFTRDCQAAVRQAGYRLLFIDDYAHLPAYDCDILLNQNAGADQLIYCGRMQHKLLGPSYALLRPEFQSGLRRENPGPTDERGRCVLLTLGGGDFSEWLAMLAPAFCVPELSGATLQILRGNMPLSSITRALAETHAIVRVLPPVDDMVSLLRATDVCVTAGGSTCWELAYSGVPFLTVQVAENQRHMCHWLDEHGYAPRFASETLAGLLRDPARLWQLSRRLRLLVDGKGAIRVLEAMQRNMPYNQLG